MTWNGIILPATTPFRDDELDLDALQRNLARWNATDTSGYLVLGTSGELTQLDDDEQATVMRVARELAPRERALLAGIAEESTRNALRKLEVMASLGADGAVVLTPHYHKAAFAHEATQVRFVRELAEHSPLPVMIYDFPANTGIQLGVDALLRIAEHERIVGIKDTSPNLARASMLLAQSPGGFSMMTGLASCLLPGMVMGMSGGILAIALLAPALCTELVHLARAGQYDAARPVAYRLARLEQRIAMRWSTAGVKAALGMLGFVGGACRRPMQRLDDAAHADIRAALNDAGLEGT